MNQNYYTGPGLLNNLGQAADTLSPPASTGLTTWSPTPTQQFWGAVATVSGALCAWHGYKRSRGSLGWTAGWFLMGSMLPVVSVAVAMAQGFGKPAVTRNRRARRMRSR